jgi:acetoin utilization deacetylase AcuC-like enzyme
MGTPPLTIFTHDNMCKHISDGSHPEHPARLKVIMKMIAGDFPDTPIETAYSAYEDDLLLAHPQSHIDAILDRLPDSFFNYIDDDTYINPQSYKAARLAIGASIQAVKAVLKGETKTAFAAIRPPGHHAEFETAMGFCLFNNIFITAKKALEIEPTARVIIIDFDVHHGNGTQDLVERHAAQGQTNIAYASIHQSGIFPHTGHENTEYICNAPLLHGTCSKEFREAVLAQILPFAQRFKPTLTLFSAGFDGHAEDDIAGWRLSHEDYGWIVETLKELCPKIVSLLEGGYDLDALPVSVNHHLKALAKSP